MCMSIPILLIFLSCLLVLIDYKGLWDVMVFFGIGHGKEESDMGQMSW